MPRYTSLIIPLHDEASNVVTLVDRLVRFNEECQWTLDIIIVDDGSKDDTYTLLNKELIRLPCARLFRFRTNIGKSGAYALGFAEAKGEWIATMDGDMQDDPDDLMAMAEGLGKTTDFVCGWKWPLKNGFLKGTLSKGFNTCVAYLSGLKIHDINCPLRIFRREAVENISLTGELFRYIPLLVHQQGFRVTEQKVKSLPRHSGSSKFNMRRYPQTFFDLFNVLFLGRYNQKPLHFFGMFGAACFATGFFIDLGLTINGLFITGRIGHTALLMFGILMMLMGLQIILFGFLGILITSRIKTDYHKYLYS